MVRLAADGESRIVVMQVDGEGDDDESGSVLM